MPMVQRYFPDALIIEAESLNFASGAIARHLRVKLRGQPFALLKPRLKSDVGDLLCDTFKATYGWARTVFGDAAWSACDL